MMKTTGTWAFLARDTERLTCFQHPARPIDDRTPGTSQFRSRCHRFHDSASIVSPRREVTAESFWHVKARCHATDSSSAELICRA